MTTMLFQSDSVLSEGKARWASCFSGRGAIVGRYRTRNKIAMYCCTHRPHQLAQFYSHPGSGWGTVLLGVVGRDHRQWGTSRKTQKLLVVISTLIPPSSAVQSPQCWALPRVSGWGDKDSSTPMNFPLQWVEHHNTRKISLGQALWYWGACSETPRLPFSILLCSSPEGPGMGLLFIKFFALASLS